MDLPSGQPCMEGKVIESTRDEESRSVDLEDPPAPASDRVLRIGLAQEDEGIRRVKCDEEKPDCLKCSSTGRACEWFSPGSTPKRSASPAEEETLTLRYASNKRILLPLPDSPFYAPEQSRSFTYFRQRTVYHLSGVFDSEFWDFVLLQATHHNETLRHAVVALGSLHERFESCDPGILKSNKDRIQGGFALQEYIKAIGTLTRPTQSSSRVQIDVFLVACSLFAAFEALRGHSGSALSHVHAGVRMLAEVSGQDPDGLPIHSESRLLECQLVPLPMLVMLFTRLDTQLRQLQGNDHWPKCIARQWQFPEQGFSPDIPEVFLSIDQARNSMDYAWSDMISVIEEGRPEPGSWPMYYNRNFSTFLERQALRARSMRWLRALDALLDNPETRLSPKERKAAKSLRMAALIGAQALETASSETEMEYDKFYQNYAMCVDVAAEIVDDPSGDVLDDLDSGYKASPRFQLDMGIVVTLFETIWKCRDSKVRRKGIALLERNPRQEGLWDGVVVAKVGREIMKIEQGDLTSNYFAAEIPEWRRVQEVDVKFDQEERKGVLMMSKAASEFDNQRVWIHKVVQW